MPVNVAPAPEPLHSDTAAAETAAEAEDASAGWDAGLLHSCGVRADYLLAMTFALGLWEWQTWEVVQFLVKPATEGHGRCRFVDLAAVRGFKGPASVFVSHCWGGKWGDFVAAAAWGARCDRMVWIDLVAVLNNFTEGNTKSKTHINVRWLAPRGIFSPLASPLACDSNHAAAFNQYSAHGPTMAGQRG